ncbi:Bestrophin [Oesophagostomum dentatum]|uniref:Bestrophin homolog n=1 Tax=Oesophagostomum dentatum TaxID=61180 RepID=A0A0B1TCU5_OESDE|nr:Bestrophin [Oesophagostomum dentatum]
MIAAMVLMLAPAKQNMTVSYSGNFMRLLLRWKGSIWRSVWIELVVFLVLYYAVRLFYVYGIPALDEDGKLEYKKKFHLLCKELNEYTKIIPLTFLLGFYVSNVVSRSVRWWRQFECLSWPEDLLSIICMIFHDNSDSSRQKRHQIARYLNLVAALAWYFSFVFVGLLGSNVEAGHVPTYYLAVFTNELKQYRNSFRKLFCHDWVCVPLVYTQVASLATYTFFFFCLLGRQHIDSDEHLDTGFPLFTIVQFLFYVGWFKVGQDLMRPFGLDDDDIELSYILDRNLVISFAIVDCLQTDQAPDFEPDVYWRHLDDQNYYTGSTTLKFGRIDLSRTAHKHPPKLHTYVQVRREEKALNPDEFSDKKRKSSKVALLRSSY